MSCKILFDIFVIKEIINLILPLEVIDSFPYYWSLDLEFEFFGGTFFLATRFIIQSFSERMNLLGRMMHVKQKEFFFIDDLISLNMVDALHS